MNKIDYKTAYENVIIANKMLEKENKQLKEDKKKAIEYIKECEYHLVIQPQKLLEILGDKENE